MVKFMMNIPVDLKEQVQKELAAMPRHIPLSRLICVLLQEWLDKRITSKEYRDDLLK